MTYILGIDLGTTNSCAAVLEAGEPMVIENGEGARTTPSVVAITASGEQLIGQVARRQAITNPENTVFSIKRFIGRTFDDAEVRRSLSLTPYTIVPGPHGDAYVRIAGGNYAPPQVSAMILSKLKSDVEARLGEEVTEAVITVPAYFDDAQRQATKDAGRIAGLRVLRIVNEPTAAALAYGFGREQDEVVAVYDLGGGTFDISILQLGDGVFEVKSTNGDTHLGGDDFDGRIIDWLADLFHAEQGIDLRTDRMALQRLREAAERAKIELSSALQTTINLPFVAAGPDGPLHLAATLTRSALEGLVADLVEATAGPCHRAMVDAEIGPGELDTVILVGGQSRMPAVQALVRDLFGREPSREVNPDEVVAIGAAIQGGALAGSIADILLLDVTPLTLGVETHGGTVAPLIRANATIPTTCSEVFTTGADDQDSVEIHITQGERPIAGENRSLARFHLDGIPPAPRGAPQIEVSFALDANGILSVAARDSSTGRAQRVTVAPSSGLCEDDVDRMVREAALYVEQDRARQETIALRNEADALLYSALRVARDAGGGSGSGGSGGSGGGVPAEQREKLDAVVSALKLSLPTGDTAQIRERMGRVRHVADTIRAIGDAAAPGEGEDVPPRRALG